MIGASQPVRLRAVGARASGRPGRVRAGVPLGVPVRAPVGVVVLQDRGRAEEVTQDAFVRLFEKWGGAVTIEHPQAWVRKVAIGNAIRRAQRERFVPVREVVDREGGMGQQPRDLDLMRAVASLPPQQRAAVALYYLEDLRVDEVAHLLELAPATVRQHLFRARRYLSSILGEALEEVAGDVDR